MWKVCGGSGVFGGLRGFGRGHGGVPTGAQGELRRRVPRWAEGCSGTGSVGVPGCWQGRGVGTGSSGYRGAGSVGVPRCRRSCSTGVLDVLLRGSGRIGDGTGSSGCRDTLRCQSARSSGFRQGWGAAVLLGYRRADSLGCRGAVGADIWGVRCWGAGRAEVLAGWGAEVLTVWGASGAAHGPTRRSRSRANEGLAQGKQRPR